MIDHVISALKDIKPEKNCDESTRLYGEGGILDSIDVVDLATNLEERFDNEISLQDDRAFSQSQSPFESVSTLAKYIGELLGNDSN